MPPAVEPVQPPINDDHEDEGGGKGAPRAKSPEPKPVVVMIETTVNAAVVAASNTPKWLLPISQTARMSDSAATMRK